MDDPPAPDEAIAPMPQATGSSDQPGVPVSSTEAAGPRIMLQQGGTLQERAALSDEAESSLKSVLQEIKGRILPGVLVTDQEFRKWIDMIYADDWHPGQFCEGGDDSMTRRTAEDCPYIGTLRETVQPILGHPGSSAAAHRTYWQRQAGAPVRLSVDHSKDGRVWFTLRDLDMADIFAGVAQVNFIGDGDVDAYFQAMHRNDEFMASKVHKYNMTQGVYICRNRLTHWSNPGTCVGQVPPSEHLDKALSDIMLCRNVVSSIRPSCPVPFDDSDAAYLTGRHLGMPCGCKG